MQGAMKLNQKAMVLAAIPALSVAGCMLFNDIRVPERILVDNGELPALESAHFLQSSLRFHPESPAIAARLESEAGIDRGIWSLPVQQAMSGRPHTHGQAQIRFGTGDQGSAQEPASSHRRPAAHRPGDLMLSEHLNRITEQTKRVGWNGHSFYFMSTAIDTPVRGHSGVQFESTDFDDPRRYHMVYAIDEKGRGSASFRTGEVEPVFVADGLPRSLPSQPLQFDIVVTDDGPWILYRDNGGIFARTLVFDGPQFPPSGHSVTGRPALLAERRGSFSFGEARLIARTDDPYGDFQFIARVDDRGSFHTIWTDSRSKNDLWYCRYHPETDDVCRRPRRLSRSASRAPVNLMVRGDQVYVTWVDNRYTRGFWTKRNYAKLFVAKSDDRGGSFGSPVSINPPRDNSENVGYSVTMPASNGGVLIFWGTEWMGTGAKNQDLHYSWLQPDMKRLLVGKNMFPGDRLHVTLVDKLLHHHRNLDAP